MKKLLVAMFVALMMVGCGNPDLDDKETLDEIIAEAIDSNKIQKRGEKGQELLYAPNEQTPYSGWRKRMYGNGQVKNLVQVKDGRLDGLMTTWYENGQKESEEPYKDGTRHGLETEWYKNGQKFYEKTWKDGKLWTAVAWKLNGEKVQERVVNGNGFIFKLDSGRHTYKNGEEVY